MVCPPPGATARGTLDRAGHPTGGGPSCYSGISAGHPHKIQRLGGVLPIGGGGGGGTDGAGGRGGSGPGGGGISSSPELRAGVSPNMDLPAIIRSTVEALIAAVMQGVAAVTTAAVEAHSAADNRGKGLYIINRNPTDVAEVVSHDEVEALPTVVRR